MTNPSTENNARAPLDALLRLLPDGGVSFAVSTGCQNPLGAELSDAFSHGSGPGLLRLARARAELLGPNLSWWLDFALTQASRLCRGAGHEIEAELVSELLADAPSSADALKGRHESAMSALGASMAQSLDEAAALGQTTRKELLSSLDPAWAPVGRIHFDLAENDKPGSDSPFVFGASYGFELRSDGAARHIPLARAIKAFANAGRQSELDSAVLPLYAAAKKSAWIKDALAEPASGPFLKGASWGPAQAWLLLRDAQKAEDAGIRLRLPESWGSRLPKRARVQAFVGSNEPAIVGARALLDFKMEAALDGQTLSPEEIALLGSSTEGLVRIRGQWVQADPEGLGAAIRRFKEIEARAAKDGLSFADAMRAASQARADFGEPELDNAPAWEPVRAGAWLEASLAKLRSPETIAMADPGELLQGTLRPYQSEGLRWMSMLHGLGLGACLADDMGLGKTIQILSLLLVLKRDGGSKPSLLAAPASLLENWAKEAATFAPSLKVAILHGNASKDKASGDIDPAKLEGLDLAITSYGTLCRSDALRSAKWRLAIADEAQAIKNPSTQAAKSCKSLMADSRVALTGTPVENRLGDLWSILDFTHPGLLGSRSEFNAFHAKLVEAKDLEPLRSLVRPYILRRKKTDKSVIADLPDKIETTQICHLTARQAVLYQAAVEEMRKDLATARGFGRHGVVIAYLSRLKQICNHPAHWLRDGAWRAADSGKIQMLRELAEEIAESDGRLLVFTQYQEAVAPLTEHLASVFGSAGLSLHGGVRVGKARQGLVDAFQAEEGPRFMVLTVKAGGTGLNLTSANHVIHFDRWWNPAVENQATDRAYRIGQTRNVSVHKFVCKGTIEERIDHMIASKIQLAEDAIGEASGDALSSLSDQELLELVRLDIHDSGV